MNVLGGQCELMDMTPSYMKLKLDAGTDVELKLLEKRRGGHIISLVITTLKVPHQSVIAFYDAAWKLIELPGVIELPQEQDFSKNLVDVELREVKQALTERGALAYEVHFQLSGTYLVVACYTFDEPLVWCCTLL